MSFSSSDSSSNGRKKKKKRRKREEKVKRVRLPAKRRDERVKDRKRRTEKVAKDANVVKESLNCQTFRETI